MQLYRWVDYELQRSSISLMELAEGGDAYTLTKIFIPWENFHLLNTYYEMI